MCANVCVLLHRPCLSGLSFYASVYRSAPALSLKCTVSRADPHGRAEAWAREASDAERRKWIYLQDLGFKA